MVQIVPASSGTTARNAVFVSSILCLLSCWITVALRTWVRITTLKSFGWDDATLICSTILFTAFCTVVVLVQTYGGAYHVSSLTLAELEKLNNVCIQSGNEVISTNVIQLVIASFALYLTTMIVFKISLGILYLRLVIRPWHRYIVYGAMVVSTAIGILLLFVAIFSCGNPTLYLKNELAGICMQSSVVFSIQYTGAAINAATDWTFAILPVFLLMKVEIPRAVKVSTGLVLLLGCCGSFVSLFRIHWIKGLTPGAEFFRTAVITAIWSIVELGLGITAAAIATLRPLFRGLMGQARSRASPIENYGSLSKSPVESSNVRGLDATFGDWHSPVVQHELQDLENQDKGKSHFSMTSVPENSRIISDMGITQDLVRQDSGRITPTARAPDILRENSLQSKTRVGTISRKANDVPVSDPGVRPSANGLGSSQNKLISRPIRHVADLQAAPPTPTFGQRRQQLFRVDPRRNGSSDWVSNVDTNELRSPASSISCCARTAVLRDEQERNFV
ncbi:Hypothetical predicted protein [Lecanosticta acicola]|uniref:Rhodopsin domain-containing protein n=1 Tax=Lecanosticta acicola TaxID=111012 RepID=A0AAI8YTK9_9PEZI|nr:Hypothetical predicted protein [Lecanosticta acicola]